MKALMLVLVVGCAVALPKMVLASELPQCAIELKDAKGTTKVVVDLNLLTYPQSDLAAYAYRGEVGGAQIAVSTCDGHYIASIKLANGARSLAEGDAGVSLEAGSAQQTISIVCP